MSRTSLSFLSSLLWLGLSLAASVASADPVATKLVFTYPCSLVYDNGEPYVQATSGKPLEQWECDYLHATVGTSPGNGAAYFNALSPLARQKAVIEDVIENADDAHDTYKKGVADLLKKTNPAKISAKLTPQERVARLDALQDTIDKTVLKLAKPFLWPPHQDDSYVEVTNSDPPASWRPYLVPLRDREKELEKLDRQTQMSMAKTVNKRVQERLSHLGRLNVGDPAAQAHAYDGSSSGGAIPGGTALGLDEAPHPTLTAPDRAPGGRDLATPSPPIPTEDKSWDQRNYFSRGAKQGALRLRDDATITLWHALGQTHTVGDPDGAVPYIVEQKGPSCGVGAQYEALRARGINVDIQALAKEASDKGYFVDYSLVSGDRAGGTDSDHLNSLLIDHGVSGSRVIEDAKPAQLLKSIRTGGGALVSMSVKDFWNDPTQDEDGSHVVYVSGAEVDAHGVVRGYYVNDTGTGEAKRFVSVAVFNKAWQNEMVSLPPITVVSDTGVPKRLPPSPAAAPGAGG